jgi:hypothetical protein
MKDRFEEAKRLMYLALLSQSLIDEIDDGIGLFKMKTKQRAKSLLEDLMALMNKDLGSDQAVDQLVNLTIWHKEMYNVLIATGKLSKLEQECFQQDWEILLNKYKLK